MVALIGLLSLVIPEWNIVTKISLLLHFGWLDLLMFIIYKGEYVYWISGGPDYEVAKTAKSSQRKKYAFKHLMAFLKASAGFVFYILFSFVFEFHIGIDFLIFLLIIIVAAFSTIKIKF